MLVGCFSRWRKFSVAASLAHTNIRKPFQTRKGGLFQPVVVSSGGSFSRCEAPSLAARMQHCVQHAWSVGAGGGMPKRCVKAARHPSSIRCSQHATVDESEGQMHACSGIWLEMEVDGGRSHTCSRRAMVDESDAAGEAAPVIKGQ